MHAFAAGADTVRRALRTRRGTWRGDTVFRAWDTELAVHHAGERRVRIGTAGDALGGVEVGLVGADWTFCTAAVRDFLARWAIQPSGDGRDGRRGGKKEERER